MEHKTVGIIVLLVLGIVAAPSGGDAQEAVFLVRHAEQSAESEDPSLTEAGQQRARALIAVLKDAGLDVIYTSETRRTIQTAEPLAKSLNIEMRTMPRRDIDGLISRLRTRHGRDRVLVVSHSLSIPALLKALGHPVGVKIGAVEYDSLFVIVPKSEGPPLVLRLRF